MNREWEELAARLKLRLTPTIKTQLGALEGWLETEAIPAGGVGPGEAGKLGSRHLGDSLAYAAAWEDSPPDCADLGSGVGLPGLVLAAVWPSTQVTLFDRSEKRCDLARRAARVARIPVSVVVADIFSLTGCFSAVVSRAVIPAARLRPVLERLLATGGQAVVSGDGRPVDGYRIVEVLDRPTRLLMMQRL